MKKKYLLAFVLASVSSTLLTGCNVKFIEKVETTTESSEDLGHITGDDLTDDDTHKEVTVSTVDTSKTTVTTESSEKSETSSSDDNKIKIGDYTFMYNEHTTTGYIKADTIAYTQPAKEAKEYQTLKKGDVVIVTGVSDCGTWNIVRIDGGPSVYMYAIDISYEYIEPDKTLSLSLSTESSEESSSETSSSETSSSEQSSSSQQPDTPPSPPPQEPEYQGIPFPSNPVSTTWNFGVEFADVYMNVTIRESGTQASNGPGKIANSTGYVSIATFNKGDVVVCTGIGRNGFVRIDYNGTVAFIDSKLVNQ